MKYFDWNQEKNEVLKQERGVSFEEVQTAIEEGRLLENVVHHNRAKYPNQRMFVVMIGAYAYIVPYVEDESRIFLKTIIPSRKATKKHLKNTEEQL